MWKLFARQRPDPTEMMERGVALAKQRRDKAAVRLLETALPHLRYGANVLNAMDQLSMCYSRLGDHHRSADIWAVISKPEPKIQEFFEPHFWSNRAMNLLRAGDEVAAVAAFRERIELDDDQPSKLAVRMIESGNSHVLLKRLT